LCNLNVAFKSLLKEQKKKMNRLFSPSYPPPQFLFSDLELENLQLWPKKS